MVKVTISLMIITSKTFQFINQNITIDKDQTYFTTNIQALDFGNFFRD